MALLGRFNTGFFCAAPKKKLKAKKLKNSETQAKKLKLKPKSTLFGIFCRKESKKCK